MAERSTTAGMPNSEQHQQAPESFALEKEMKQKGRAKASLQKSVPYYKLFSHADGWDYLLMIVGGLAAIAHGVSIPVFYIFLGKLINSLGSTVTNPARGLQMGREVSKYALYFFYLSCARFVSGWLEVSLWMYTGDRQSARIRAKYVRALIMQEVGFFDTDISTGQVVIGISSDTALIQDAIGAKTGGLIHCAAQFVGGFIIAFSFLWQLSLVTLAVMPVIVVNGGIYAYIMVGLTRKGQHAYVTAGEIAQEVISQIRTVQSFVGEGKAIKSYSDALLLSKKLGKQSGLTKGLGIGLLYGLGFASFSLLLWYGGKLIRNGVTNGGVAFTTIINVISSSLALGQAAPDVGIISKAKVSGYTILEVIKRKPLITHNESDGLKLGKIDGNIELRDITFSYPSRPDINVFEKFSLSIPAGKVVAIVGSSGSGKSTIISLIERFYDPTSGEVLLDGHNIKSMQLKWLREQMGLVNQEPALFATSILENIMYGKDGDVSMNEVVKAASVSCAHDFIDVLPKRYDTQVGERGVQLSGGQKQRIAIARAMLRNPSILLLDEATSALDAESEKSVQEALDQVMLGRTTVIVAHRLSTIQNAEFIVVLQEGRVAEVGSHKQLLEKGDAYATLIKLQKHVSTYTQESAMLRHENSQSVSQRTFSFRSNTESIVNSTGLGGKLNGSELDDGDDLIGPRPSWKRLIMMNASEWPYGLLGAFGAIVAGSQTPLFALIITQALEYFYSPDPAYMKRGLTKLSLLCCGAGVLATMAITCEFYFSGIAGENITMHIRRMMFTAILQKEIGWFDQNSSTLLASRLSADAPLVRTAVVDRIITFLQNTGLIVTAFIISFKLQWKVALVMISTFPALIASQAGQMQYFKGFSGDLTKAYMRANMVAGEAVSNIRTVAAFSAEDKVMGLFWKELKQHQKQAFVRGQIGGLGFGISQFFLFSSYGLALWYGSGLMQKGEASFGELMKCFMVLIITSFGVAQALSLAPEVLKGTDSLRSVFHILDRRSKIDAHDMDGEEVGEMEGAISFRCVDFSYPARANVQIFKDFNLNIRSGRSLALVGASGSGKSSVIALIVRFYDPQNGQVMVDGRDIKQLQLKSLRQQMGLVQQEPALFSTSIYENIRYGKEGATESEIVEAAKAANAHGFISGLPDGYKTEVGERGVQLSGGQKQRVAIARAVLRNPVILLLDEATSALDAESENLVQEALGRLMQRRTTVLVAHRLSTIQNADSIAVLQSGAIVEEGSHSGLLAKQGAYFQLLNLSQRP